MYSGTSGDIPVCHLVLNYGDATEKNIQRMKISLINPNCFAGSGRDLYSAHLLGPLFTLQPSKKMALGLPLALPTLAAATPPEHSVRIIDEEIEDIDFDAPVDLVGLTAMTFKAERAYEIAHEFRRRGVKVVMGGIHASMCPEEVSAHVDSVVIGEAEELWPMIVNDAKAGQLKKQYRVENLPTLKKTLIPRYDLVSNRSYLYSYLQTTRGCPFDCNFCTVTKMNGRTLRRKSPAQVIDEVDALLKLSPARPFNVYDKVVGEKRRLVGMIAFIDDNFAIDREHALAVCHSFRRYQEERRIVFFWYTQVNYSVGLDEELLAAMAASGCRHLFIGFENLDPDTLRSMQKKVNRPEQYAEAIRNIEGLGMRVVFSTIIGDDNTSRESAEKLKSFIDANHVFHVLLNILTPYPGTSLYENMHREGRILTRQPQLYNIRNVVFQPKKISANELQSIYRSLCRHFFSFDEAYRRGCQTILSGDRFDLPMVERLVILTGLFYTIVLFTALGRLRWNIAWRLCLAAPKVVLIDGSLAGLEILLASADYDEFVFSEEQRLKNLDEGEYTSKTDFLIDQTLMDFCLQSSNMKTVKNYRAFYIPSPLLSEQGIQISEEDHKRPVLLLGGSSIPLSARKALLAYMLESGLEVASIENPIGNLFDLKIDPARERPESLREFLEYLKTTGNVEGIDIIAQSYSAFEVIRVLMADQSFHPLIKSIVLINPPGFDPRNNMIKHSFRFLFGHLLKGYVVNFCSSIGMNHPLSSNDIRKKKQFIANEVGGITFWALKTFSNIVRTLRELIDITSFRVKEPLRKLQEQGLPIYFFLQTEDQVVPVNITLKELKDFVPDRCIKTVPGGHNDLFFQQWQRKPFLDFIQEIRRRN